VLASGPGAELNAVDALSIPRVGIDAGRTYASLAGVRLARDAAPILYAHQDVRLTVDERGAEVDATASVAVGSMPRHVLFDGPFLVAMLDAGRDEPFVCAWIGSGDALTPIDRIDGTPLDASTRAPLVGRWTLDREASLHRTARAFASALPATSRRARSAEAETERLRDELAPWFRQRELDLDVATDGATASTRSSDSAPRRPREVRLVRRGARLRLLILEPPAGPAEWTAVCEGERLVLSNDACEVLVLTRR
jgi:hypothetical protein